ncbi:LysR family transcriptional regulator [Paractinoplanes abujensis]|uniref:DNA-binding transcriptional LysR family regulator n=1 Tax=Paractinoplanes abujensis TaxID=882441 RepID=A0A7W7CVN8_9ACTN|nr:LysR family transcriptional regulator [Actinoplanes abujensis]MBB4695488.1 DNA-binding transcriptional LysR family regulator [Actinoplanes abujensis]GID23072.1 LysR family transcriptional regulator [Actinoplanes abujensis]
MELRQLEYFVTVAEEANFTRAAERVRITQSGVSSQVKALEHEIGAPLFDRSGRTARLTETGAAALPYAKAALEAAAGLRQAVDEVRGLVRGQLTVGMVTGCEVKPLFAALAAFSREHPAIELDLIEDNSDRLVAGVRVSTVDVALVGVAGEPPQHLESQVIVREGLAAMAPADSEVARLDRIPLTELVAHPLVTLPAGTGVRTVLDESCLAASLFPNVVLVASAPGAVAELASRGLGLGVLSESMATAFPQLKTIPIDPVRIPALLTLTWRPRVSPALAALLPHLREAFATGASPLTNP